MKSYKQVIYLFDNLPLTLDKVGVIEREACQIDFLNIANAPKDVYHATKILAGNGKKEYALADTHNFIDHYIRFQFINFTTNNTLFLFWGVVCKKEEDCVAILSHIDSVRLWINDTLYTIWKGNDSHTFTLKLKKGLNVFCAECFNAKENHHIAFRLNSMENEDKDLYSSLTKSYSNRLDAFTTYFERQETGDVKYILFQNDSLQFNGTVTVRIFNFNNNKTIYKTEVSLYVPQQVFIPSLLPDVEVSDHYYMEFICIKADGKEYKKKIVLSPGNRYADHRQYLIKKIELLLSKTDLELYESNALLYWKQQLTGMTVDNINTFSRCVACSECVRRISEKRYVQHFYEKGYNNVLLRSKLDGKIVPCTVRVPANYNRERKYPLILLISVNHYDTFTTRIKNTEDIEDFLCADISGRGVTMGSYIGEASIQEIVGELKKIFSVDEERIYRTARPLLEKGKRTR